MVTTAPEVVAPVDVAPARRLDARVPAGPITEKWERARFELKLVNVP